MSIEDNNFTLCYNMGECVKDIDGSKVDDSAFTFVQQDKKLHDVKFTTKPTTFLKDAFKRFCKNKSSLTAAIILGILILLSLIVPFASPYSLDTTPNGNTLRTAVNLPMKLFPAGNGFWDGTTKLKNQVLPYKLNDDGTIDKTKPNSEFKGESLENVVNVTNIRQGYQDFASDSASGGYVRLVRFAQGDVENQTAYFYNYPYDGYDFDNTTYTIEFNLGTRWEENYLENPSWALMLRSKETSKNYLITEYSTDYGEKIKKKDEEMTITPHKTMTLNLSQLVKDAKKTNPDLAKAALNDTLSIGFIIKAEKDLNVAFYLHDFRITSDDKSEEKEMSARSFGSKELGTPDANTLVRSEEFFNGKHNKGYWATGIVDSYGAVDTFTTKCDVLIDKYKKVYGYVGTSEETGKDVEGGKFKEWIDKGYITYDFTAQIPENTFKITEKGLQSKEVYVEKVFRQKETTEKDGTVIYTMVCRVLMYRFMGYKSMPVHIFGTDQYGKDIFKYVFSALRTSLLIGVVVALINIIIGVIWGSISGYFGGATDLIMERITDVLSGIPSIVLMTIFSIKLDKSPLLAFVLALCVTGWIGTASITRSQFYRYRDREYVLASKTLGAKSPRLIFRHILPNAVGPLITSSVLMIPSVISSEATLAYLGLGLKGVDSLGVILSDNQKFLATYPYQLLIPAIIMSVLMICFNLFGNGLRDAVNPQLKGTD